MLARLASNAAGAMSTLIDQNIAVAHPRPARTELWFCLPFVSTSSDARRSAPGLTAAGFDAICVVAAAESIVATVLRHDLTTC